MKKEITDVDSMLKNTSVFNSNIIGSNIDKDILSGLNMGYSIDNQGNEQMTSGYSSAIEKLAGYYKEATAEANALKMAQDGLAESTVKDILAKQNWSEKEIEAAISSNVFRNAQKASTAATNANTSATWANVAATKVLSVGKKALGIIGGIALSAAISVGISALVKLVDTLIPTRKELEATAEAAKQSIKDIKESFDNLESTTNSIKQRYAELSQGVDQISGKNLSLSTDDYNEFLGLSNQLAELFPTLTKNYDSNGNAILDLSGNVNSIVSSLDALVKKQRDLANEEMLEKLPDVYAVYSKDISSYSKQLDNANKKQEENLSLYNQLKDADYELFGNNKAVKFHLGNIDEKEKYNLTKELTSAFDDLSHYTIEDIGTLENKDTTITLYLENEFSGIETILEATQERMKSAKDEISEYSSKIETEVSSFNSYINTWLEGNWVYQQDESIQSALKQVLFNKDWIGLAKDSLGKDAEWDEISQWLEDNYIKAISNLEDTDIKQKFIDLFTMDLSPQETINLAQELQAYFDDNDILVSLDFILNPDDPNSTQNLVDRFYASRSQIASFDPEGYNRLKEYTNGFDDNQMQIWLNVTQGAENATQAIYLYEKSLNSVLDKDISFFSDENLESIDTYKSRINDLSGYLEKINTEHKLSAEDLSDLNTTYGISANSIEEYEQAIIKEMNEASNNSAVMTALAEAIETCNDAVEKARLESLYEALKNVNEEAQKTATSFESLNEAVSTLDSSASLLRDLREEIDTTGKINFGSSDDILATFPEMAEDVALFNAGLMESEELFSKLEEVYQSNVAQYANAIESELQYNEKFYDHVVGNLEEWVTTMAEAYGINLSDYKTLNEEKLALDKEYAKRKAILDEALLKNEAMNDVLQSPDSKDFTADDFRKALNTHEGYLTAQSDVDNIQAIIDAVDSSFDVDASWEAFGKDDDSGSKDDGTEIDWADQSLKVLQDEVDKFETALSNTKGIDNQINAIDDLNGALKKLKSGYKSAYDEYEERYTNTVSGLGSDIRNKIESGEEFDLSKYSSTTAESIQNAIEYYNNMKEALAKIDELSEQIDINKNIEKSKLLQQSYESQLATINTKLDDQTLSVQDKNKLLDDQLKLQNAINKELRKQAKYEEDFETVSKLKAEDKNNKLQNRLGKLQNKKDENQVYIDTYGAALDDTSLTSDDIDSYNNLLEDATNKDFKYQFKEKIAIAGTDTWKDYIASLKEKYSEQNMKDKEFIKKHLGEISKYFSYTGMEELYYEYMNSGKGFKETDYETKKNERSYYINDSQNDIQDIQNDIESQGGRGTEIQYKNLESLYSNTKNYWIEQKQDAEAMLKTCEAGTADWDKWNSEIQECENNISECDANIKDCHISILKLPLNDIDIELLKIEGKLRDINKDLNDQTELISAAEAIIDMEIENEEVLKKAVQDQIDKLEEEKALRESNLAVQKAEYELEKLKNQKTSKVFHEGQGWIYESDQTEIRDAQYNLDNAVYEHKLALLNDHITVFDKEIDRLNVIKKRWTDINTEAERLVLINKALAYDPKFIGKVLEEDSSLLVGISSTYSSLFGQKSELEDQQEDYTTLQDIINDTVEMYNLEAIGYVEAKQRVKNAISQYYPEIVANYDDEAETLDRVATKKLEDAGVTETTSSDIVETVKDSNKKIIKNYNKLVENLDEVFGKLNGMLDAYSQNTQAMVTAISTSIAALKTQLADAQTDVDEAKDDTSSGKKKGKKNKEETAKNSHRGLELGYIGESSSKDKEAFKYIALNDLKDDELVRVLQKGEGVLNSPQITQVMDNFRKLSQVKIPTINPNNTQSAKSINFNGDIVVQGVSDVDKFAKAIKTQLPNAMLQELYK